MNEIGKFFTFAGSELRGTIIRSTIRRKSWNVSSLIATDINNL